MIGSCCDRMRWHGRDHYEGVPESELPDAIIEHFREENRWMLDFRGEGFTVEIHNCPWCGRRLSEPHRMGPPLEPRLDEQNAHGEAEFERWCLKQAEEHLAQFQYVYAHSSTNRDKVGNLICRIRLNNADGYKAIFITEQSGDGTYRHFIQLGLADAP